VDMVIFRENTEDVYAGIEWPAESEGARAIIGFINDLERRSEGKIRPVAAKRDSVTLVHKGNIMKFTEGAFKDWGYELAKAEFGDVTIPESELTGDAPAGKIVIK